MAIRGGSFLTSRQPVFSSDGKFLLVCTGCTVSILSCATGLRVAELHGHSDRVTGIVVVHGAEDAKSSLTRAWTCSMDGTIRLWNFVSGKQIKCVDVGHKVASMVIPALCTANTSTKLLAFISVLWEKKTIVEAKMETETADGNEGVDGEENAEKDDQMNTMENETQTVAREEKDDVEQETVVCTREVIYRKELRGYTGRVLIFNLTSMKVLNGHLAKTSCPRNLYVSHRGTLAGMADIAKVWLWKVPAEPLTSCKQVQGTVLHSWQRLTAMAFDPTETTVAAGDRRGQIAIWKNVGERTFYTNDTLEKRTDSGRPQANDDAESCTTYHWHSQEVTFLTFTSDSAYLLSGGLEAVLVIWQLSTGKQQFLPRLAAPLSYITNSPVSSQFVISLADNSLKFFNISSMKIERVIQGIKPFVPSPHRDDWLSMTRLALHCDGRVVFPSVNVALQFYDVFRDQHAYQIQVSPRNFVSTFDQSRETFAQTTLVTHVAFSEDASVMATVDLRVAQDRVGGGSFLKFWIKTPGKAQYILHTSVDGPHSEEILGLAYHPSEHTVVTCSRAKDFKIWSQVTSSNSGKVYWKCCSVGSYKQKRMRAAAFSTDGTLLAVAADEYISLWNPSSNRLLCALSHPGTTDEVVGLLRFIARSPYLVSASYGRSPHLAVWNLDNLSVSWSYNVRVEGIAIDPDTSNFAVLTGAERRERRKDSNDENGYVCLFKPESPVPVSVWEFKDGVGGALEFLPASFAPEDASEDVEGSSSKLIVFNKYREYILFNPYVDTAGKAERKVYAAGATVDALSAYETMYGPLHTSSESTKDSHDLEGSKVRARRPWGSLLNGPSHVLPPLSKVGEQVLASFLRKRT